MAQPRERAILLVVFVLTLGGLLLLGAMVSAQVQARQPKSYVDAHWAYWDQPGSEPAWIGGGGQ